MFTGVQDIFEEPTAAMELRKLSIAEVRSKFFSCNQWLNLVLAIRARLLNIHFTADTASLTSLVEDTAKVIVKITILEYTSAFRALDFSTSKLFFLATGSVVCTGSFLLRWEHPNRATFRGVLRDDCRKLGSRKLSRQPSRRFEEGQDRTAGRASEGRKPFVGRHYFASNPLCWTYVANQRFFFRWAFSARIMQISYPAQIVKLPNRQASHLRPSLLLLAVKAPKRAVGRLFPKKVLPSRTTRRVAQAAAARPLRRRLLTKRLLLTTQSPWLPVCQLQQTVPLRPFESHPA